MSVRRSPGGSGPGGRAERGARSDPARAGRVDPGRAGRVDPGRGGRTARADPARAGRAGRSDTRGRPAGSSRPAAVRRPAAPGAAKRTRAPNPRRFTGRAAVLGMVLLGLLLAYAYPVRVYLAQQAEIAGLEQKQQEQRRRIAALTETREKWDDDEYVRSRARNDLHYVLPGETAYIPLPDPNQPSSQPGTAARRPPSNEPWYRKLWGSVDAADRPEGR